MKCSYCRRDFSRTLSSLEIFLPQKISHCSLCVFCQSRFTRLDTKGCCHGCQRQQVNGYCIECINWQKIYPAYPFHHEALYRYDSAMQEWFESYKFKGNYQLRETFSEVLSNYFKQRNLELVVPIPVSHRRFNERGFNQVTGLLKAANISYTSCLLRLDEVQSQAKKNRQERLLLKQPFKMDPRFSESLRGKRILLVDDVYTTGRTLFHAAAILNQEKPAQLNTFSLAR